MESNNNIRFSPPHAQPAAPEDSFREPLQDDASHEEWHDEGELDDGLNPYFQNLSRAAYEGFQAALRVFENHLDSIHGPNLDDKPAEQRWYDGALLKLFAILMLVGETLPYFEEDERKALTKINRAIERVKLLRKMPESCD